MNARAAAGGRAGPLRGLGRAALYVLLGVGSLTVLVPFLWTASSSVKQITDIFNYPPTLWPPHPTVANYADLFGKSSYLRWYANTIGVAAVGTGLTVFFSALAGFGFAKYEFRFRGPLFRILIATLVVPTQLVLIPLFILISKLGWSDSYQALIVPFMAPAFGIFLMRQFLIGGLPRELLDAARIDGCSEIGIFFRIVIPLIKPAIGALSIYTFLGYWNSFMWPLIIMRSQERFTLPIGLQNMYAVTNQEYGMLMAGAFLAFLPMIVLFVMMQRQFIAGLTVGSVKG